MSALSSSKQTVPDIDGPVVIALQKGICSRSGRPLATWLSGCFLSWKGNIDKLRIALRGDGDGGGGREAAAAAARTLINYSPVFVLSFRSLFYASRRHIRTNGNASRRHTPLRVGVGVASYTSGRGSHLPITTSAKEDDLSSVRTFTINLYKVLDIQSDIVVYQVKTVKVHHVFQKYHFRQHGRGHAKPNKDEGNGGLHQG